MFNYSSKVYFTFALILFFSKVLFGFQRICYFTNWSQYRQINSFKPEDIDPLLCTHIIYAFGLIENGTMDNYEADDIMMDGSYELGSYARIMNLKKMNSDLKIMLAVGGWNAGSYPFDQVIINQTTINTFANQAVIFLRKWKFDGLDIDWEFPTLKKQEFTKLLETLRLKFEIEAVTAASEKLILSAALSSGQAIIDTAYDLKKISQLVDFINLMTYDLHGSWENVTGFHTALYSRSGENDWKSTLNVNWTVQYLLKNGMAREKIMMGLGFYGHGWILSKSQQNIPGSRTSGQSLPGKIVTEPGILSYAEICMEIDNGAIKKWNNEQMSASIQINDTWIGYDDKQALQMKVKYALSNCLGGIMIWSLDLDDFNGKYCNQGAYPLLNTVIDAINNGTEGVEEECSNVVESSVTIIRTSNLIDNEIICNNETELISDIDDCTIFYLCLIGIEHPISKIKCPENMWFDLVSNTCIFSIPHRCKSLPNPLIVVEQTNNIPVIINNIYYSATTTPTITISTKTSSQIITQPLITSTTTTFQTISSKPILITKIQTLSTSTTSPTSTTTSKVLITTTILQTETVFINSIESKSDLLYEDNFSDTENFKCPQPFGLYSSSLDCNAFIICSHGQPNYRNCPTGLVFNPDLQTCDYTSPHCSAYNFYKTKKFLSRFKSFGKTEFSCPVANGLFENKDNCSTFWNCANEIQILMECPQSLVFNSKLGVCDYTSDCKNRKKEKKIIIFK